MTDQTTPTNKSAAGLLSDAIAHMSSLVRKEVDLARAEVSENVSRAGVAIGLLAGALVLALTALNVLAAALVAGLAETDPRTAKNVQRDAQALKEATTNGHD